MHDQASCEHVAYGALGISCHFKWIPLRESTNHGSFACH
jgi:hypothetical protein